MITHENFEGELNNLVEKFKQFENDENYLDLINKFIPLTKKIADEYKKMKESPLLEVEQEEERLNRRKQLAILVKIKDQLERFLSTMQDNKGNNELNTSVLDQLIDAYNEKSQVQSKFEKMQWRATASQYVVYTGMALKFATMFILAVTISLEYALKTVGIIFPPALYLGITVRALFDARKKSYGFKATKEEFYKAYEENKRDFIKTARNSPLFIRYCAAGAAALFNLAAAITFSFVLAGMLVSTFPVWSGAAALGLAFVGAAAIAGWVSDGFAPTLRLEKECTETEKRIVVLGVKMNELTEKRSQMDPRHKKLITLEIQNLQQIRGELVGRLGELRKEYEERKADTAWGGGSTFGVILAALAWIPVVGHVIALIGNGAIGLAGIRGGYNKAKEYFDSDKKAVIQVPVSGTKTVSAVDSKTTEMYRTLGVTSNPDNERKNVLTSSSGVTPANDSVMSENPKQQTISAAQASRPARKA